MDIVSNHYDQLTKEFEAKIQKINSISRPNSVDEQLQFTLKQFFKKNNELINVWQYAGMPIKLSDIENNLDYEAKNPNVLVLMPGPKLQAKKSTVQLLLYFFITYKDISTINKELFKIIYDRIDKENDYTTLNYYFNCLSNYNFDRKKALNMLTIAINKLDIKFFDYADIWDFANTKFPELNLFELELKRWITNDDVCLQIIKNSLQNIDK
jgi:hypothetical protein